MFRVNGNFSFLFSHCTFLCCLVTNKTIGSLCFNLRITSSHITKKKKKKKKKIIIIIIIIAAASLIFVHVRLFSREESAEKSLKKVSVLKLLINGYLMHRYDLRKI